MTHCILVAFVAAPGENVDVNALSVNKLLALFAADLPDALSAFALRAILALHPVTAVVTAIRTVTSAVAVVATRPVAAAPRLPCRTNGRPTCRHRRPNGGRRVHRRRVHRGCKPAPP